ncbi:MAG: DUF1343 domain-containing protein [Myxococcota bacterium]|jgi:uncharacterized protein YbbC (DUF1343 family)|nr:DUF1343 domain-containing protein [Myxococcota bacterium]
MTVFTGLDRLFGEERWLSRLRGKRLALLVHAASVNREIVHLIDLCRQEKLLVGRIFAPEHGLWADAQDMEGVEDTRDPIHELPIRSLYGASFQDLLPKANDFDDIELLIIDLQDIGARYYTFVYSAALCIEQCAKLGVPVLVLDRPNPIGGLQLEGNVVEPELRSFVGLYGLATRHGMTIGEALRLIAASEGWPAPELVSMQGWQRSMYFEDTGLPWVLPSPNMPTVDTAVVYPGGCLWEGTRLSEGRGSTRPFELFGAPWLNPSEVLAVVEPQCLEGVRLRRLVFRPTFHKFAGQSCRGFQLHVHDREHFRPLLLAMGLLRAIGKVHPEQLEWRREPYEFVADRLAIDLLLGAVGLREQILGTTPWSQIEEELANSRQGFEAQRREHLLY